jgi:CRP/FNR family transcriptional regulator, anaerobic regulatory protein
MATVAEARYRIERAAAMKMLDARARICVAVLDLHDRLRKRGVIRKPQYYWPFTQEQLGEYVGLTNVHVSRMLRDLQADGVLRIDRQSAIIEDIKILRECASGLPHGAQLPVGEK